MRHRYFGKKLSRTKNERQQLFKSLVRSLMLYGSIRTSLAKAKAIQGLVDTLITKAKNGSEQRKREVMAILSDKQVVVRLFAAAKTQFEKRTSGFTRIIKLGPRRGDGSQEAIIQFVDQPIVEEKKASKPKKSKRGETKQVDEHKAKKLPAPKNQKKVKK